jgi:pimeloyl-ACP methyl ester carboxylesterase
MIADSFTKRGTRTRVVRAMLAAILSLSVLLAFSVAAAAAPPESGKRGPKPTVVLVHGAWADASGWNDVSKRLQRDGYTVLAPANPLRGLAYDAAYIGSVLDTIQGPVVLVGHSYGGAVITNAAAGRANVVALVYIAAMIPAEGEDLVDLVSRFPGSEIVPPGLPGATLIARPYPLPGGGTGVDTYIDAGPFRRIFAADVDAGTAALMAAAQRPFEVSIFGDRTQAAAWRTIPSWALVAKGDKTIGTDNVRFMARRATTNVVEVNASHVAMISKPGVVADLIQTADRATR